MKKNRSFRKILACCLVSMVGLVFFASPTFAAELGTAELTLDEFDIAAPVAIKPASLQPVANGTENYEMAFEILEILNQERVNAGLNPLKMDKAMLDCGMLRARECAVLFSHTRPDGTRCFTSFPYSGGIRAENIAMGQRSAAEVMTSWMNSTGHRTNILYPGLVSVGIGVYNVNGCNYLTQVFSSEFRQEVVWNGWLTNNDGTSSFFQNGKSVTSSWINGTDGQPRYLNENGFMVTNQFQSDGAYTYFLQADGTPMKNRLTYHPNGVDLIYFDKDGHELFDTFQYCEDVGYTCYFNTFGYLYKDEITFSGGNAYYLDGNGRMKQNEYFRFNNGVDLGYANADGSLINNGFGTDPFGQTVFYHWNGMIARGLITDGLWFYNMDLTDGHLLGQFSQ